MNDHELQKKLRSLEAENRLLKLELKRNQMEKAISDGALSRKYGADMRSFFDRPLSPWFQMYLFYGRKPPYPVTEDEVPDPLLAVEQQFTPLLCAFGQTYFFSVPGGVACLLNFSVSVSAADPDTQAKIKHILETALRGSDTGTIDMSEVSDLQEGPRKLYRGAISVSEHRQPDSPSVCSTDDLPMSQNNPMWQVLSLEPIFWQQIQRQDFYHAAETLDKLIRMSDVQQGSLERSQATVFSRMELVMHSVSQAARQDVTSDPELSQMLARLPHIHTYQELQDTAHDFLALLEDKFCTPPQTRNKKMVSIERYILEHYREQSLDATAICQEFKISPSYLSRIFKTDMGMGVVDYIHQIRIDAAKQLLRNTDANLDEIAIQVGFSGRWSLIRVFKGREGISPGFYRTSKKA